MKSLKTILITALLVGTLDGLAAIVQHIAHGGDNPVNIFRFIASGVFGEAAFSGGNGMVFAGALFHYLIASIWTFFFFFMYPRIQARWKNPYLSGILYGIFIWLVMNKIVLPLSNTPALNQTFAQSMIGVFILILAVGLPVSLIWHRALK